MSDDTPKLAGQAIEYLNRIEALELALTQSRAETAVLVEAWEHFCKGTSCFEGDFEPMEDAISTLLATPEQSAALDAVISEKLKENAKGIAEPCPCTLIEQDESCPVGYPSLLCSICQGTGNTTSDKVTALACEMLKIANDLGEAEDPFAAWEVIVSLQEEAQLQNAMKAEARAQGMREAAEACTNIIKNYDCMKADGETYQPMWVQKVAKGMVSIARQDILAAIQKGEQK